MDKGLDTWLRSPEMIVVRCKDAMSMMVLEWQVDQTE